MSGSKRYVIGIDLGTSNSALAYIDTLLNEESRVLPIEQPYDGSSSVELNYLPSFLYLDEESLAQKTEAKPDHLVTGHFAREQLRTKADQVIHSAKSWLCHGGVSRLGAILPWQSETVTVEKRLSPVAASAAYLRKLKESWNEKFAANDNDNNFDNQAITITVPASFDDAARELTLEAAKLAKYPNNLSLLEEPQAAFYSWFEQQPGKDKIIKTLDLNSSGKTVLVCDVGGGTTDFSLFEIFIDSNSEPITKRIAVGEHLLLGGDNIDLTLAHIVEQKLRESGPKLTTTQFSFLIHQARNIKEDALSELTSLSATDKQFTFSIPSSGASLMAGARSAKLSTNELYKIILDGFFPECKADSKVQERTQALSEWGLPYAADSAITRHLASFLNGRAVDAVLFAGGSLKAPLLQKRIFNVLKSWQPNRELKLLANHDLDLTIAKGAAFYQSQLQKGKRLIESHSARSFYLELQGSGNSETKLVCLLPFGTREDEQVTVSEPSFKVLLNQPVQFRLCTARDRKEDKSGEIISDTSKRFHLLPAMQTVLNTKEADLRKRKRQLEIEVELAASINSLGLIEIYCIDRSDRKQKWKLTFNLSDKDSNEQNSASESLKISADQLEKANQLVSLSYGKKSSNVAAANPKHLRQSLEKILKKPSEEWDTPLLRALWPTLAKGNSKRGRSLWHEATWLNLAGFLLRPGCGAELDNWRISELWRTFKLGLFFPKKPLSNVQYWIMWRRVAGGLDASQQEAIYKQIHKLLRKERTTTPEVIRLAAALERLSIEQKTKLGDLFVKRLLSERSQHRNDYAWGLGRIGSRVPLFSELNHVLPPKTIYSWYQSLAEESWHEEPRMHLNAAFIKCGRLTGDRNRDLDDAELEAIRRKISSSGGSSEDLKPLVETNALNTDAQNELFGEELPLGIKLA